MKVSWLLAPVLIATLLGSGPAIERSARRVALPPVALSQVTACGDRRPALRTLDAEYRRAVAQDRWASLLEIGDAYRCVGDAGPHAASAGRKARQAYEAALHSARRAESVDGVLRAAQAFARLGDAAQVEASLRIARRLAAFDPEATADVEASSAHLADLLDAVPPAPARPAIPDGRSTRAGEEP